jgi:TonB family protein
MQPVEKRTMKLRIQLLIGTALPLLLTSLSPAQTSGSAAPQTKATSSDHSSVLKAVYMPPFRPSGNAAKIEGKLTVRITVDAEGKVIGSEAVSGPLELYESVVTASKLWTFEPPPSAPFVQLVDISWGFPKPCPASIADSEEVAAGGWFQSKKGNVATMADDSGYAIPKYPANQRHPYIAGTVTLSVSVNREGKVKKIRVASSLSPELDKSAVSAVRTWRFKLVSDKGGGFPDQFEVPIDFTPLCNPTL